MLTATSQQLAEVEGIGPERANALCYELSSRKDDFYELLSCINVIHSDSSSNDGAETVGFTGKMPEKRSYYAQLAESVGLRPVDDVSSTLTYLVAMDPSAAGGKLKKAQKYGVKVLALDDFIENIVNKANNNVENNEVISADNNEIEVQKEVVEKQEAPKEEFVPNDNDDLFSFSNVELNLSQNKEDKVDEKHEDEDEQLTLF